ncbi:MAG: CoA activase [Deltaproteobacteria bacterium]|nr:CoA activase [Deltaproteobacteria bacterium]
MRPDNVLDFQSLTENVGRFDLRDKTLLVPEMARIGSHVFAAAFRGFGINAKVMDTCKGLDLGKEYTSGKECYPCQITTGDILYFLKKEQDRLGDIFNPEDYVYFMPEAEGPCRFGMYNKYQRIVLDSFPALSKVRIGSITTSDGYSLAGLIEKEHVKDLRKSAYLCVVVADILDRLLWRIRPYEKETGMADDFITKSMHVMEDTFETYVADMAFAKILDKLEEIVVEGKAIIDPSIPPKPLVGIVGEIYLRTHIHANQDLIRVLERHGAEVVNASIAEWVNFTTYEGLRTARKKLRLNLKQLRFGAMRENLEKIISFGGELLYQQFRQKQGYQRVRKLIDLAEDHDVAHLESILEEEDLYSFDAGTEACLGIAGIVEYVRDGYNGVVNVYPFTCMPSMTTSAIIKPLLNKLRIPYLDTPYDSGVQPGRETAIRTFMYQAHQHFTRHGRKAH